MTRRKKAAPAKKVPDKDKAAAVKQLTEDLEKAVDSKVRPGVNRAAVDGGNSPPVSSESYDGIAVLGSNPHTIEKAPWGQNWRFYACSPHNIEMRTLPRVHEWFECHLPVTDPTRQYEYLRRLEDNHVAQNPPNAEVIWARDPAALARWKDSHKYPELELRGMDPVTGVGIDEDKPAPEGMGIFCPFMFTSSIAYIMAKAICDIEVYHEQGRMPVKRMGIWGVMQASETEYTYQRPGIQYFIWEASKRGIQVIANQESKLFELPRENW
jgi:hypothetical protein